VVSVIKRSMLLTLFFVVDLSGSNQDLLISEEVASSFIEVGLIAADCSDAVVKLIKDAGDRKFVLKQIVDSDLDEQFLLVRDLVSSEIGVICGIPVNKVFILAGRDFEEFNLSGVRFYSDRAATIHEFIDGNSLDDVLPPFLNEQFCLQQRFCNFDSPWQKKWPLKEDEQGMTKNVLVSMSVHSDLPKIVAFDTFVGNSDRSLPNIFYDEAKGRFYGIDHAAAFNSKNLPLLAFERLEELEKEGFFKSCDEQVINGLRSYYGALVLLYKTISPGIVEQLFKYYSGCICINCQDWLEKRILGHVDAFKINYEHIESLIELLDRLIKR